MKEQTPTSAKIWDSQETQKRQERERLQALKQELKLDITLSVLSLIRANEVKELKKIGKDASHGHLTYGISFDSTIGIKPKEDKATKERKRKEFAVSAVNETLDRLWGKQSKLLSIPNERQILTICMELEKTGKTIQDIKNALSEALGVDLLEGPNLTSSPALLFPKDTIRF